MKNFLENKCKGKYILVSLIIVILGFVVVSKTGIKEYFNNQVANIKFSTLPTKNNEGNFLYKGHVYHIFFHSLVIYPELAFRSDEKGKIYSDYMITNQEFSKILTSLYENNFVLVDIASIYTVEKDGKVKRNPLYLPKGKKPLIISLDDQNYYSFMKGRGFADKLVIDKGGNVATQVTSPEGKQLITRDGDVVPMLDDFVKLHPDFSVNGAKGVIAVTGFEGILGYRTQVGSSNRENEIKSVQPIIKKLKATGWEFASHSYSHDHSFQADTISLESLKIDTQKWKDEVETLVGKTDIFVGPFGQIFKINDARRNCLVEQGYKMILGVGLDSYLHYFPDYVAADRTDIDGYRLTHDQDKLKIYFDSKAVLTGNK